MQRIKSVTSETISLVRFPLAALVVIMHCFFPIKGWQYDQLAEQGWGCNLTAELMLSGRILTSFVVIFFFLIAGYLFFIRLEEWNGKVWKQKISRRIWTLLIPYILWNTLYIVYCLWSNIAGCFLHGDSWEVVSAWVNEHGGWLGMYWNAMQLGEGQVDLWGHPAHSTVPILLPLYFVRNLMVLDILSPLFFFLLRSRNQKVSPCAIATLMVLAFLYLTQTSFIVPGFTAEAFFFYGWGAFLSLNRYELSEVFYTRRWPIAIVTLCLFLAELYVGFLYSKTGKMLLPFFAVFELMTAVNFASWMVKRSASSRRLAVFKKWMKRWQNASFMLFALHFFFLPDVFKWLNKVGGALTGFHHVSNMEMSNQYPYLVIMIFLLQWIIVVSICTMVYILMQKLMPRVCKLLCGR